MSTLGVRISRWSLLLSLAVKAGLAAWVLFALLGEPTGTAALPAPGAEALRTPSAVEEARETRRERRERQRRERLQRREEAARAAAEKAEKEAQQREAAAKEAAEKAAAAAREAAAMEAAAKEAAEKAAAAAREAAAKEAAAREAASREAAAAKRRNDHSVPGKPGKQNAVDAQPPPKDKARTEPGKTTASNALPVPAEPEPVPDKWSDQEIIAALEECLALLAPIAAHIDVSKPIRDGQCGSAAVVQLKRVGATTPVEISPPATLNCRMVVKLHQWVETSLQPAAREMFNAPVRRLVNASGYTCRNRYGSRAATAKISEHAFANALDISAIVTADGRSIDVLSNWGHTERDLRAIAEAKAEAERQAKAAAAAEKAAKARKGAQSEPADAKKAKGDGKDQAARKEEPPAKGSKGPAAKDAHADAVEGEPTPRDAKKKDAPRGRPLASAERTGPGRPDVLPVPGSVVGDGAVTREGAFLRRLHRGACGIFSTVLGPEANEAHRNHFHFDLAPRRRNALCE